MKIVIKLLFCLSFCLLTAQLIAAKENWPFEITPQCRPGAYWWCPGSAFDKESIDWNLHKFDETGFGTVHIIPIYGAKGYEDRYIKYLSPQWIEMLDYILAKTNQIGMQVDMSTGTGWCFGGPDIPKQFRDAKVQWNGDQEKIVLHPGMNVKRPAPGGEGPMLNALSPDAMTFYLRRFSGVTDKSKEYRPRAQFHDSYEYHANWSTDFLEQFAERRGYDLKPHLQTFFGETTEANRELKTRLKYDYRRTLADLHLEYIQTWAKWAKKHGMLARNEAHGSPSNLLDVYAAADIPETEMFGAPEFAIPGFRWDSQFCRQGDTNPLIMKLASSAANIAHRPARQLVSSESFTWLRENWHGTLGQMKLSADLFFLAGVNHMFYHGSCYSPHDVPWPGWYFYASSKTDWRNSIWRDISFLNDYIARCQSVLQAGQPANDVLVYWPIHDLWMDPDSMEKGLSVHSVSWMDDQSVGRVGRELLDNGYAFDFISDLMLKELSVRDGLIQAPGGSYQAILIPACKYMPLDTAQQLAILSKDQALVIFEQVLPEDVPGLEKLDEHREEFASAKTDLQEHARVVPHILESLAQSGIHAEPMALAGLKYICRLIDGKYWYFIANHSATGVNQWITFSRPFSTAVSYDPMRGLAAALAVRNENNRTQAYIQLAAGQSTIIQAASESVGTKPCQYLQEYREPVVLEGSWKVEFIEGAPSLPKSYTTEKLASWTELPNDAVKAFAGTARYSCSFQLPDKAADEYVLDLGDVRESARVRVNDTYAGVLFSLPFRLSIADLLKPGVNTLEIEVTNLTANRIRALERSGKRWKNMQDINIVNVNYQRFDPASWPVQPSGLLGPVRLIPMHSMEVARQVMPL